jgi:glutamate-1-semialdehyde 2,1-aminomutase
MKPDLVTYGKIIGGGFPVGAYGGRADLMDLVAPVGPVYHAGTLSGNPFGMRAGLATLKKLKKDNPYRLLAMRTSSFAVEFANLLNQYHDYLWWGDFFGSIFWFHPMSEHEVIRRVDQIPENHKSEYARLFHALLSEGIYFPPSGFEVGFLSTTHNDPILTKILEKTEVALKKRAFMETVSI